MTEQPSEQRLLIEISPEVEVGVFANFASIWHDQHSFTLDFAAVIRPPSIEQDDSTGGSYVAVPARIVARVRIPPAQVFEVMKALEQQLTAWEKETGQQPGGAIAGPE